MKPSFNIVWKRITNSVGDNFYTKTGLEFQYDVDDFAIYPSRTKYRISKSNVEVAYGFTPFDGPGVLNYQVRGPSYLWAILHDPRIRLKDW